jgi:hypothetical protein
LASFAAIPTDAVIRRLSQLGLAVALLLTDEPIDWRDR